jgi:hypothetical protein
MLKININKLMLNMGFKPKFMKPRTQHTPFKQTRTII